LTITRKRKEGRLRLVAVGINTYPGELALRCARQDAEAFHQLCTEFLPIRPEDAHIFLDGQATKRSLMRCFGDLRKKTKPEDTVFVFLAGHGWIEEDDEYFLPADADLQNLFASAIGMDEFSRILKMDAERVVVIADACYSGKIKLRGREHLFGKLGGKGRFLIGYEGKAQEDSDLGHGYLTYYFLAGVRKWDADLNRDGIITLQEAYHYAHSEIKSHRQGDLWIDNQGNIDIELRKK